MHLSLIVKKTEFWLQLIYWIRMPVSGVQESAFLPQASSTSPMIFCTLGFETYWANNLSRLPEVYVLLLTNLLFWTVSDRYDLMWVFTNDLGNACCAKISWHFQAFQNHHETHESSRCTCPVTPLQCPLADWSHLRICNVLARYLAHSWYYHKSLDKVFKWKQPWSQKHRLGQCRNRKGPLTPLNSVVHFPGEETGPAWDEVAQSGPTNWRFCGD